MRGMQRQEPFESRLERIAAGDKPQGGQQGVVHATRVAGSGSGG